MLASIPTRHIINTPLCVVDNQRMAIEAETLNALNRIRCTSLVFEVNEAVTHTEIASLTLGIGLRLYMCGDEGWKVSKGLLEPLSCSSECKILDEQRGTRRTFIAPLLVSFTCEQGVGFSSCWGPILLRPRANILFEHPKRRFFKVNNRTLHAPISDGTHCFRSVIRMCKLHNSNCSRGRKQKTGYLTMRREQILQIGEIGAIRNIFD